MSVTTRVGLLAGAAALTVATATSARPAEGQDDVAKRLAAAEAKIAELQAQSNQSWLTEQRADEIRGLVQDVLADADTRASLLQAGMTAGYDNGMALGSSDGNWLLRTNFLMQQRFIWNSLDAGDGAGVDDASDENRWGFENTRSKFIFSGHVVNPDWYYLIDINFGSNGGVSGIGGFASTTREDTGNAYLGHDFGNGWKLQMGSQKLPLLREELIDAQYQLAVERSNVNYLFTGGYADGLQVMYEGDALSFMGMLSDGIDTGQTPWSTFDTEYALTARVEFLASGNREQFRDFTSERGGETGVLLGAAAHYEEDEYGTATLDGEVARLILTGDVQAEFGGFNLFAAVAWNDNDSDAVDLDTNPFGFVVQGGAYLNESWELFGRYEFTDFDVDGADDLNIVTVGVNRYFSGHNAKWTTDVGITLDPLDGAANITGFRPDVDVDGDEQFVFRTQWQILF